MVIWDIKDHVPQYDQHPKWIILRVFEYGRMEDIADIINYYGFDKVSQVLTHEPHLSEDIMDLASAILEVPVSEFLCYITKQYRRIY